MFLAFQNAQPNLFLIIFGFAIAKFVFAVFSIISRFQVIVDLKYQLDGDLRGTPMHPPPGRPGPIGYAQGYVWK